MDSQLPPNAKSDVKAAVTSGANGRGMQAGAGGATARRYPRPPGFIPRFLMLCFRPESWAEAARYPTYITLIPLVLAIVLGGIAISTAETTRLVQGLQTFADDYSTKNHYPPLQLNSDGVLSVKGELKTPIRMQLLTWTVVIDPTKKNSPDNYRTDKTLFVTDKQFVVMGSEGVVAQQDIASVLKNPLSELKLPKGGETSVIDQAGLQEYVSTHKPYFVVSGVVMAVMQMMGEAIWCAIIMFLICPLVMLAAAGARLNQEVPDRRLILPKRAAYRMAAALLIPIVLISAALRAAGHPVYDLLGLQGAMLFWFFSAVGLALWTGTMARQMYLPKDGRRAG